MWNAGRRHYPEYFMEGVGLGFFMISAAVCTVLLEHPGSPVHTAIANPLAMKFTAYEAAAIQPLVANSPLMSWLYQIFSVQAFSNWLGVLEVAIAVLIAARPISAFVSAIGSGLAAILFLGTLSFMLSSPPVWEASLGGFPALSVAPGQFLLKDLGLPEVRKATKVYE